MPFCKIYLQVNKNDCENPFIHSVLNLVYHKYKEMK